MNIKNLIQSIKALLRTPESINRLEQELKTLQIKLENERSLIGKILSENNKTKVPEIINNINISEFKVYSQWGDDGIIQFLINYLDIDNKTFIEFGVETYKESNTRFLLINDNWKGLVIDSSDIYIKNLKKEDIYWQFDLTAICDFVTKNNINQIFNENGFNDNVGLLHIDIDGNDYWIWKEIKISPVIVIIEYNSVFGCESPYTIPYNDYFSRTVAHHSNLYFGSSLLSLVDLAEEKGYYFIGCNSNGNNAYFVRKDKIKQLKPLDVKKGFIMSKFRENRDKDGNLTFISSDKRIEIIKGMEVFNTRTKKIEKL